MKKRGVIIFIVLLSFLMSGFSLALAVSDFPNRPIETVIPFSPGGGFDFVFSAFKDRVGKILGQPIISVFKPGGGGAIGAVFVAKSKPDGYTLLFDSTAPAIIFSITKKDCGFTMEDFAPVVQVSKSMSIFCVRDDSPYKTMRDFIQAAKTKKMKYATYGVFSSGHIVMERLGEMAGFQAIHVPYPGAAPAMAACLGGHVDMGIGGSTGGMVGPGMLRILAIPSDKRSPTCPEVPTFMELGYDIYLPSSYFVLAPKGTPKERIDKIYSAFKKVVGQEGKEIADFLFKGEYIMSILGPDELGETLQKDRVYLRKLIAEMGMLPQ